MVDQRTWDAIHSAWVDLERDVSPTRSLRIFPGEGFQVSPGMSGGYMILPQTMFQILSQKLNGIVDAPSDGYHGDASVENTRWLQGLAQLEQTGVMDRKTWDMLSRLYELFVTAK